jgi:transcriptional regulator with XRE-family HTH domain
MTAMANDLHSWRNNQRPKVTQMALADRLGIGQGALSEIERGERGVTNELAVKIFKETGVRLGLLAKAKPRDVPSLLRALEAAA